jgi:transglutaminase-like putative cysteine protease
MDIRIQHRTSFAYEALASHSIQLLRLTPHEHDGQRVGRWTITGNGRRDLPEIEDAFGNILHSLSMSEAHDAVEIAVSGVVHTMDTNGVVKGLPEPMPLAVYLRTTDLTEPDDTLRDLASRLASTATRDPLDTAHRLMEAVRGAVDYRTGTTGAATTAAEALGAGK